MQIIPKKIISINNNNSIKYSLRLKTIKSLNIYEGINICLIDNNENAYLKRLTNISYNNDNIYEFDGPIINSITNILVSSESKCPNIINLELIYLNNNIKFNCINDTIYFKPQIKLNPEMGLIYNKNYLELKNNITINTIKLILLGTFITIILYNIDYGYSFFIGGNLGLIYINLLEYNIDNIEKQKLSLINNGILRLLIIFILSTFIITKYNTNILEDHILLLIGIIGFMMYKIALIYSFIIYNK